MILLLKWSLEIEYTNFNDNENLKKKTFNKILGVLSGFFSIIFSLIIIFWVFDVFDRDVEDLPIIESLNISIKTAPKSVENKKTRYTGFEVNEVLEKDKNNKNFDDVEVFSHNVNTFDSQYESPPININNKNKFEETSDYASAITQALENLLGEEQIKDEEIDDVNVIQLGSYQNEEDANIHKYILSKNHSNVFEKIDFRILKTKNNDNFVYRLRGYGLINYYDAKELCDYFNKRGEDCLLVKENNE